MDLCILVFPQCCMPMHDPSQWWMREKSAGRCESERFTMDRIPVFPAVLPAGDADRQSAFLAELLLYVEAPTDCKV